MSAARATSHGALPEEAPVALVYNGSTAAVMMASPFDLSEFLVGFAVSEGIVECASDVTEISAIKHAHGYEVRGRIPDACATVLDARRRASVGPMGCGLCGVESLEQATAFPGTVAPMAIGLETYARSALEALGAGQKRRDQVGAMHAAGFFTKDGLIALREDVGRHNALDKLIGALAQNGSCQNLSGGAVIITSRLSVDLVQKCARAGISGLFALSSPTRAAVELAQDCGMTLMVLRHEAVVAYANEKEHSS